MRPAQTLAPAECIDEAIDLLSRVFGDLLDGFEQSPRVADAAGPIDVMSCNVDLPTFRGSIVVQQAPDKGGFASILRTECQADAFCDHSAVVCTAKLAGPVDIDMFTRAIENL